MSHSRSPSLNTRVSRFRDGYDYDESLASTSFLRPRDSSPSAQKRVSIFKEHTTPAMGTTLFNADHSHSDIDLSRPETHYDPYSQRDSPPSIYIERPRGRSRSRNQSETAHSDEERLLHQARAHADAHVDTYRLQRRKKSAASAPPPELSSHRGFYLTRWVLRMLSFDT